MSIQSIQSIQSGSIKTTTVTHRTFPNETVILNSLAFSQMIFDTASSPVVNENSDPALVACDVCTSCPGKSLSPA